MTAAFLKPEFWGDLLCSNNNLHTDTLAGDEALNGVGMEVGVREVHLSVFPISTVFPQGSFSSTPSYWPSAPIKEKKIPKLWHFKIKKGLPYTGWEPLLLGVRPK